MDWRETPVCKVYSMTMRFLRFTTRRIAPAVAKRPRRGGVRGLSVFAIVVSTIACGMAAPSCASELSAQRCTSIPVGGCPLSRGVACEDPACVAVYACNPDTTWQFVRACDGRDASASTDVAPDATLGEVADAALGSVYDASFDPSMSSSSSQCLSLQLPDCPVEIAQACSSGCCGCEEWFRCESGGWTYVGSCN